MALLGKARFFIRRWVTRAVPREAIVYLQHVLGLWKPGQMVPVFEAHPHEPGDLSSWTDQELSVALEEGRRQLDRLGDDLERVRGRGQFLFTTAIGFLVVAFAGHTTMLKAKTDLPLALWALSIAAAGLGMLGGAAIIVTRKDLRAIDTVRLTTTTERPLLRELVAAYARCVRDSTNTVATQITLFRDAVWLVLLGAVSYGVAWLIAL